jgi:hypothetical protein
MKIAETTSGKDSLFSQAHNQDPDLHEAVRQVRLEFAERAAASGDLRGAEIARLEMLWSYLDPVFEQLPKDAELFDQGMIPGERPRLYIDMVGFVEMARDRKTYRLVQDTRAGRFLLCESDKMETMAEAVTAYIGRRLVQRESQIEADFLARSKVAPLQAKPYRPDMVTARSSLESIAAAEQGAPLDPRETSSAEKAFAADTEPTRSSPAPSEPVAAPASSRPSFSRTPGEATVFVRPPVTKRSLSTFTYGTGDLMISFFSGSMMGIIVLCLMLWAQSGELARIVSLLNP